MRQGRSETGRRGVRELHLYFSMVGLYFFAFGMQFVLFPALTTFLLAEPPTRVGLAQAALSLPMFALLLFGGVAAERTRPGPALAILHLAAAAASFALALIVVMGALSYGAVITYALWVGASAAFIMPIRDAALNGVIGREAVLGREKPIAAAAAAATAVQIGAQIGGILVARFAGDAPATFLAIQGGALALAAFVALTLHAPKPVVAQHTLANAFEDAWLGLLYAFRNPVVTPMLVSAVYTGVFMVGAAQVLFPLLIREIYGGDTAAQANRLGTLFAAFWAASFVSALVLSRIKTLEQPGRALLLSHLISAAMLLALVWPMPFWALTLFVMLWGLAAGVAISVSRSIVQGAADKTFLGRVLAIYSMGFMGGAPAGALMVGIAASLMGPQLAALFPAIGLAIAALALAALTPLWRLSLPAAAPKHSG